MGDKIHSRICAKTKPVDFVSITYIVSSFGEDDYSGKKTVYMGTWPLF